MKWCLLLGNWNSINVINSASSHLSVTSYTQEKKVLFSDTIQLFQDTTDVNFQFPFLQGKYTQVSKVTIFISSNDYITI